MADYLDMLAKELAGQPINKSEHRRGLVARLDDRSHGSVERKHQNISAILIELGCPYVFGYKPLRNYQAALFNVVADRLDSDPGLGQALLSAVQEPVSTPPVGDLLGRLVDPPQAKERPSAAAYEHAPRGEGRSPKHIDYLAREARNSSLGLAGEEFVLAFEKERLQLLGKDSLADRIRHVAVEDGDGAGFDILSFEGGGQDRYIEVKTTAYDKLTPYYLTRNEVRVSSELDESYHLYRVFRFRRDPRLFDLPGALNRTTHLTPTQFSGVPA